MSPTIPNQAKLASVALAAVLALTAFGTGTALAASPAQECTDAGGMYVADGPNSTCTFPATPVGNSDNTKGGSQETGPGNSDTSTHATLRASCSQGLPKPEGRFCIRSSSARLNRRNQFSISVVASLGEAGRQSGRYLVRCAAQRSASTEAAACQS